MDYSYIIRRAFEITWNYRALWVFGVLLALTTGAISRGSGSAPGTWGIPTPPDMRIPPQVPSFPIEIINALILAGLVLICLFFILGIVAAVVRYISETAAIRMVDRYETNGEKLFISDGFRLGWSIRALRFFLIDLLFGLLLTVIFLVMMSVAAAPLLLWLVDSDPARVFGTVTAVGLFLLVILIFVIIGIAYSLFSQFFRRAAIMENLGVFESMRRGFDLVVKRLGSVILVGVILYVITLIWGILMIPIVIGVLLAAGILGALPGLLAGWIATFFTEGPAIYVVGVFFGLPAFLLALLAPLLGLNGLFEVFRLSAWTIAYRQVANIGARGLLQARSAASSPDTEPSI